MDITNIDRLPPELLHAVFGHLSVSSLLSFAQTSRSHYVLATHFLDRLEIAVFSKQLHCKLAFLSEACRTDCEENDGDDDDDAGDDDADWEVADMDHPQPLLWSVKHQQRRPELYQIGRTSFAPPSRPSSPLDLMSGHDRKLALRAPPGLQPSPRSLRQGEYIAQNEVATTILTSNWIRQNLKSLTLHLYSLQTSALATALATLSTLQHLNLNFNHPYINDTTLPANYWRTTPPQGSGSPVWNILAGVGEDASSSLKLRNLQTLTLRRADITSYQLRCWVNVNPKLKQIHLEKVKGVDLDFVNWLAKYIPMAYRQQQRGRRENVIEKIVLKDCSGLYCQQKFEFSWIETLVSALAGLAGPMKKRLALLSLLECKNVDDTTFCILAEAKPAKRAQHDDKLDVDASQDEGHKIDVSSDDHSLSQVEEHAQHNEMYYEKNGNRHRGSDNSNNSGSGILSTTNATSSGSSNSNSETISKLLPWSSLIRRMISPHGIVFRTGKKRTGLLSRTDVIRRSVYESTRITADEDEGHEEEQDIFPPPQQQHLTLRPAERGRSGEGVTAIGSRRSGLVDSTATGDIEALRSSSVAAPGKASGSGPKSTERPAGSEHGFESKSQDEGGSGSRRGNEGHASPNMTAASSPPFSAQSKWQLQSQSQLQPPASGSDSTPTSTTIPCPDPIVDAKTVNINGNKDVTAIPSQQQQHFQQHLKGEQQQQQQQQQQQMTIEVDPDLL